MHSSLCSIGRCPMFKHMSLIQSQEKEAQVHLRMHYQPHLFSQEQQDPQSVIHSGWYSSILLSACSSFLLAVAWCIWHILYMYVYTAFGGYSMTLSCMQIHMKSVWGKAHLICLTQATHSLEKVVACWADNIFMAASHFRKSRAYISLADLTGSEDDVLLKFPETCCYWLLTGEESIAVVASHNSLNVQAFNKKGAFAHAWCNVLFGWKCWWNFSWFADWSAQSWGSLNLHRWQGLQLQGKM